MASKISRSLLQGWYQVSLRLRYNVREHPLPQSLTILHLYCLSLLYGEPFNLENFNKLKLWSHSRGVKLCSDLFATGRWLTAFDLSQSVQSQREVGRPQFLYLMGCVTASPGISTAAFADASGWFWNTPGTSLTGWSLSTHNWRMLISNPITAVAQLNSRWSVHWTDIQWKQLWSQLWSGWGHPRTKFLIWQLLQFGFFTQSRGATWKVCKSTCLICAIHSETTIHLFFNCPRVSNRWRQIMLLFQSSDLNLDQASSPCT